MLKARGLHKIYKNGDKELHILKGVDLTVKSGEAVSVLGPSGAGKSTLLHALGGLDGPTKGSVIFNGEDIYGLNDPKRAGIRNRQIGFVFQFYHLLPEFSSLENIMLPAIMAGASDAKSRALRVLKEVGLQDRPSHRPNQLSGGEQQRVAIARALINEPELLLCDEPTGNLDSGTGKGIIDLLKRLNRDKNMTIIAVTHDKEVAQWAGNIKYMKDGRIE